MVHAFLCPRSGNSAEVSVSPQKERNNEAMNDIMKEAEMPSLIMGSSKASHSWRGPFNRKILSSLDNSDAGMVQGRHAYKP